MTSIDAVIGIGLFLVFFSWSLVFYSEAFFTSQTDMMEQAAKSSHEKVSDFLTVDYYRVPVSYHSEEAVTNNTHFLYYTWPSEGARNTTTIYSGATLLPCMLSGDRVYFQADSEAGSNQFTMTYSDRPGSLNCDDTISTDGANQTETWSAVKGTRLSQSKVDSMTGMDYGKFKVSAGITHEFRAYINISGSETSYGPEPPGLSDVYARTSRYATESGGEAEIRVLVWQ